MDKNKNGVPDWLENLAYYASAILLIREAWHKWSSGETLEDSLDVTYKKGAKNGGNSDKE